MFRALNETMRQEFPVERIRVGCSGWVYKHWKGQFYPAELPQKRWFQHYAAHFDTVEINNSFYRLPPATTFDGWREKAPDGFCYAVKANRFITQAKKLDGCEEPLERFITPTRHLRQHLGPILFQLPPSFHLNLERLETFLRLLPSDLTHVFEFRDKSWLIEDTMKLLERFGAGFVAHDLPGFETPAWACGKAAYVRFHGTEGKYRGGYSASQIDQWASWLHRQQASGRSCWAYFNNDIGGDAVRDAIALKGRVGS